MRDLFIPLRDDEIAERRSIARDNLNHYEYRTNSLYDRSSILKERFKNSTDPNFVRFVDTEAVIYNREITDAGVALPYWKDMLMVAGDTDLRVFLNVGRRCFDVLKLHIFASNFVRILDFGVGCARAARHFYRDLRFVELHGCDVDTRPIRYLTNSVPFIAPIAIGNDPPLPYPDAYFDIIYSVSVFTHLSENSFTGWMKEAVRCLKPGGTAIHTLHGSHALQLADDRLAKAIDFSELRKLRDVFTSKGLIWVPQRSFSEDVDAAKYGCTFTDETQLDRYVPHNLQLVSYTKGQIDDWQDVAVFKRI